MLKRKKMQTRILLPVAIMTVVFSAALYVLGEMTITKIIDQTLDNQVQAKIADIATSEKRIASKMLSQAALFSRADAVRAAYAKAYEGNIDDENDPAAERARADLRSYFASIQQGYSESLGAKDFRIHFHLPPARSLLRLWQSKQNKSDDLQSFRNTVLTISKGPHAPIEGIEIGRGGFAIRGLAPVISQDNRYLGSVEVLSSYDPLVRFSISNDKEYIAVYMQKAFLPIATKLQNPEKNPVIGDQFVFISSTDKRVTDPLLPAAVLAHGKERIYKVRNGDHFVTVFPIKDFSGKNIGVMSYVYNASDLYGILAKIRWGIAVLCCALLLCIIGALVISVRGVTIPLNRITKELNEGSQQV